MKNLRACALVVVLALAGCTSGAQESGTNTVTVFAAASLAESFGALEQRFEAENQGVDVKLNLAGSSTLVQQINEGAPADVFASANKANMAKTVHGGRITAKPAIFATNTLTIAVPPGNPKGVRGLADLAREQLRVVVCAPQVPCGAATGEAATQAGVQLAPDSEERDVKAVLNKVVVGEADAGLVYATDVVSARGEVGRVDFPEAAAAVNRYPIAPLEDAANPELAARFVQFVLGEAGRAELGRVGFGAP